MRHQVRLLSLAALLAVSSVAMAQEQSPPVRAKEPSRITVRDSAEKVKVAESTIEHKPEKQRPLIFRVGRAIVSAPGRFFDWMLRDEQTVPKPTEEDAYRK